MLIDLCTWTTKAALEISEARLNPFTLQPFATVEALCAVPDTKDSPGIAQKGAEILESEKSHGLFGLPSLCRNDNEQRLQFEEPRVLEKEGPLRPL